VGSLPEEPRKRLFVYLVIASLRPEKRSLKAKCRIAEFAARVVVAVASDVLLDGAAGHRRHLLAAIYVIVAGEYAAYPGDIQCKRSSASALDSVQARHDMSSKPRILTGIVTAPALLAARAASKRAVRCVNLHRDIEWFLAKWRTEGCDSPLYGSASPCRRSSKRRGDGARVARTRVQLRFRITVKVAYATHESPFSPLPEKGRERGGAVMTSMIGGPSTCGDH
jgi:hypothetical protein